MIEVYQTVWAEIKYVVLAKSRAKYDEASELVKNEKFKEAYLVIKTALDSKEEFDNYKDTAQEIWNHFKNKERDNSAFFDTLAKNPQENLKLLWNLNILYQPVYLLNSRIFFRDHYWNRAWVIKNNKIRLFSWEADKYVRLKLPEELLRKVRMHKENGENYTKSEKELLRKALIICTVDGTDIFNPKLQFASSNGLEIE